MGDCFLYLQPVYERLDFLDNMPYRAHTHDTPTPTGLCLLMVPLPGLSIYAITNTMAKRHLGEERVHFYLTAYNPSQRNSNSKQEPGDRNRCRGHGGVLYLLGAYDLLSFLKLFFFVNFTSCTPIPIISLSLHIHPLLLHLPSKRKQNKIRPKKISMWKLQCVTQRTTLLHKQPYLKMLVVMSQSSVSRPLASATLLILDPSFHVLQHFIDAVDSGRANSKLWTWALDGS